MRSLDPEVLTYVAKRRIGVLAVTMADGSSHAAAIHVAEATEPLAFLMLTHDKTRKVEPLHVADTTPASLVIGFDEHDMRTAQFDGSLRKVLPEEESWFKETYLSKFPEKEARMGPGAAMIVFTPTWWRFSDWTGEGQRILSSE